MRKATKIINWFFRLAHFMWGVLTGFLTFANPLLACFAFSIFILYELDEERNIRDPAYQEFLEFALGLSLPAIYSALF